METPGVINPFAIHLDWVIPDEDGTVTIGNDGGMVTIQVEHTNPLTYGGVAFQPISPFAIKPICWVWAWPSPN